MSAEREIAELRSQLAELAASMDHSLTRKYALRFPPPENMGLYTRCRRYIGRLLREWGLRKPPPPEPWLVTLRHKQGDEQSEPVIVWGVGANRDTLRKACEGLNELFAKLPGHAPVLVTDVAEFAYFSRLGWLVEYVPFLKAPGEDYTGDKQAYLAWRYRNAAAVPLTLGLRPGIRVEDLRLD